MIPERFKLTIFHCRYSSRRNHESLIVMLDGNLLDCMEATCKVIREIGHDQAIVRPLRPLSIRAASLGA